MPCFNLFLFPFGAPIFFGLLVLPCIRCHLSSTAFSTLLNSTQDSLGNIVFFDFLTGATGQKKNLAPFQHIYIYPLVTYRNHPKGVGFHFPFCFLPGFD